MSFQVYVFKKSHKYSAINRDLVGLKLFEFINSKNQISEVFFEIISEFRKVSPVPPTPPSTPNLSPSFLHNSSLNRSQQVGNIINKPYHQSDRSTQQPFSNQFLVN